MTPGDRLSQRGDTQRGQQVAPQREAQPGGLARSPGEAALQAKVTPPPGQGACKGPNCSIRRRQTPPARQPAATSLSWGTWVLGTQPPPPDPGRLSGAGLPPREGLSRPQLVWPSLGDLPTGVAAP